MFLCRENNEIALAVDCFEQQQFNKDNSGGNLATKEKFFSNVSSVVEDCTDLLNKGLFKIHTGDSKALDPSQLENLVCGKFRLFSIDGSHTVSATLHDLNNAIATLAEGGVIIIDDYQNVWFPRVQHAIDTFLNTSQDFLPFFMEYNKLILCHNKYWQEYSNIIRASKHGECVESYQKKI